MTSPPFCSAELRCTPRQRPPMSLCWPTRPVKRAGFCCTTRGLDSWTWKHWKQPKSQGCPEAAIWESRVFARKIAFQTFPNPSLGIESAIFLGKCLGTVWVAALRATCQSQSSAMPGGTVAARFRFIPQPADLLWNCLGYGFSAGAYPGFARLLQVSTSRGMGLAVRVGPSTFGQWLIPGRMAFGRIYYVYLYLCVIRLVATRWCIRRWWAVD